MAKPYSELVAQAERAVAGVKDAELRRVAFERVLNDLLGATDEGLESKPRLENGGSDPLAFIFLHIFCDPFELDNLQHSSRLHIPDMHRPRLPSEFQ